ncbi:AlpA family transcriptional regulator [Salmonella enterica subsp. enterica serovar Carno]|uniref:helix-turn-helix transcriptional regulator n=1 Tax=Enterobacteriaceae TaxID=543 RepID=UPI000FABB1DC|nr:MULTISPECIES: AlpA family transcriptional regulator [Enterobacteriaceae]EBW2074129.1 AlpA family transcriptional regulator [Salmonella enterica subsp. enterica serovar Krefeld]ECF6646493.1 AlpA family transcriptional regulator [Salmonella enterica subsp. enterica]EHS0782882.1 AlpA family transcriptional regulator [Salmonella enterica]EBS0850499.1 AlpA family transcriptional regulator [Salmonella enterica subsp. enterica serovar Carno]EBS4553617.1 AlpA family transcriptional regulator [Salmo
MNSDRFLRLRQVEDKIGFGKSWIYRQIQLQQFPPSIRLNSRHVAWLESEVNAWIHQRIRLTRDV